MQKETVLYKKCILTSAHLKMDIFSIGFQENVPKHPKSPFLQSKYFTAMMSQRRCGDNFCLSMAYITDVLYLMHLSHN